MTLKNLFNTKMEFQEFKTEIIERAKKKNACAYEYKNALKTSNFAELFKSISDNFNWCCDNKIIDSLLLTKIGLNICHENNFWVNESTSKGFLIADSATVTAYGSATVTAYGSATVTAYGSATVTAYGSATVTAYGSATVTAYGSATVTAYGSATVRAYDSATVRAYGLVYIESRNSIEHKISDKVILRYCHTNILKFGDNIEKFI